MRHFVYSVTYSVVPINSSLLTITLCSSVITTLVYNDTKYSIPLMTLQTRSTVLWRQNKWWPCHSYVPSYYSFWTLKRQKNKQTIPVNHVLGPVNSAHINIIYFPKINSSGSGKHLTSSRFSNWPLCESYRKHLLNAHSSKERVHLNESTEMIRLSEDGWYCCSMMNKISTPDMIAFISKV
jgi:hypothetical protein